MKKKTEEKLSFIDIKKLSVANIHPYNVRQICFLRKISKKRNAR